MQFIVTKGAPILQKPAYKYYYIIIKI